MDRMNTSLVENYLRQLQQAPEGRLHTPALLQKGIEFVQLNAGNLDGQTKKGFVLDAITAIIKDDPHAPPREALGDFVDTLVGVAKGSWDPTLFLKQKTTTIGLFRACFGACTGKKAY